MEEGVISSDSQWNEEAEALKQSSAQASTGVFEVHILNFDRDIYGQVIHIELMDTIRPNRAFSSLDDLKVQIAKDVNHVSAHWKRILSHKEKRSS
jgi:FAD synthase